MLSAVYKKELLELVRDKKTLVFMILLPLLIFPALFGSLAIFSVKTIQKEQARVLSYAVVGASDDNPILDLLKQEAGFKLYLGQTEGLSSTEIRELIRQNKVDFVLKIPTNHSTLMDGNLQSDWQLHFYNADGINSVFNRVKNMINQLNQNLTESKLIHLGLASDQVPGVIKPIKLLKQDVAEKKESLGSQLGGLVSYILLPLCLMGAIYPAIDLAAGEKERGTLETLLITPVPRTTLVLGKFLTIFTASFTSALMAILSLAIWGFIFAQGLAVEIVIKVIGTLGILDLLLALFMLVPVVMFFAALVLSISIYAKNFKEAQNFMAPLSLMIFIPLIIALLPGIKLNWHLALIPISNVALAIKEILKGQADPWMLSVIWGSQLGLALLMLTACIYWFSKEKVLFR